MRVTGHNSLVDEQEGHWALGLSPEDDCLLKEITFRWALYDGHNDIVITNSLVKVGQTKTY